MIENDRHENVFFSFAFYYLLIKNNTIDNELMTRSKSFI